MFQVRVAFGNVLALSPGRTITDPVARPRAEPAGSIARVRQVTPVERKTSASDALNEPGSAEMPSAGRAFTRDILGRLAKKGVTIAPLVLHTGVSSFEAEEPPYPEWYRVSAATAREVNQARASGRRVVAVGTTVVRALETVASKDGNATAGEGWTDLVVTPERGLRVVNAMLTGLHAPCASHLSILEALASREHLITAYENALREEYLWHEFGDLHLIL